MDAMHALSLHQLMALEISPADLVRIAGALDCPHVCLFTQDPHVGVTFPVVARADVVELGRIMKGCGVTAYGLTSFVLTPDVDVARFEPAFAIGAELGATSANLRISDPDDHRASNNFARIRALARTYGVRVGIEFMGGMAVATLDHARRIATQGGESDSALTLDALHVFRTGTTEADLAALPRSMIGYVQLCDGPASASAERYRVEMAADRKPPGEGEFPLRSLAQITPDGMPFSLEIPMEPLRLSGVVAFDRARRIVEATRRFLSDV